jgi:hypothetical protein
VFSSYKRCSLTTVHQVSSYYRMCVYTPFTKLSRSLLQNVFSYYRTCSLTGECVLLLQNACIYTFYEAEQILSPMRGRCRASLLLQNVFSYYRTCSLTTVHQVSSYYRMRVYTPFTKLSRSLAPCEAVVVRPCSAATTLSSIAFFF